MKQKNKIKDIDGNIFDLKNNFQWEERDLYWVNSEGVRTSVFPLDV